ncbi:phospholipase A [Vibrio sp. S4M6]|uniref:phospholipase A n=1 Tax=Vibrio sinus TaxID=2946865 RepID=UPI00202A35D9|nr:phospholipase A [Vibrio sinus]MCL9783503.1 phospholipase A [Vibrio sinus]
MNALKKSSIVVVLGTIISFPALATTNPSASTVSTPTEASATGKSDESCSLGGKLSKLLTSAAPDNDSILEQKIRQERKISDTPGGISFYKPTYILPFYYTGSPYQAVYTGQTPDDQEVMHSEFKSQFSFRMPLWRDMFGNPNYSLNAGYTQLFYWQFYAKSQYFRETDYEPEVFFSDHFQKNWRISYGVVHQSNGRGGEYERSWNRIYANLETSGDNWLLSIKPWKLVFKPESSDLHNPNIAHYLGHEKIRYLYRFDNNMTTSVAITNIESGMQRGSVEVDYTIPVLSNMSLMLQYFNGYGQSLIEYDHRTQSVGIGFSLAT